MFGGYHAFFGSKCVIHVSPTCNTLTIQGTQNCAHSCRKYHQYTTVDCKGRHLAPTLQTTVTSKNNLNKIIKILLRMKIAVTAHEITATTLFTMVYCSLQTHGLNQVSALPRPCHLSSLHHCLVVQFTISLSSLVFLLLLNCDKSYKYRINQLREAEKLLQAHIKKSVHEKVKDSIDCM